MICATCNCQIAEHDLWRRNGELADHHISIDKCFGALLEWRKEADQRLIDYETRSTERQELLEQANHFLMLREPEAESDYEEFRERLRLALGGA